MSDVTRILSQIEEGDSSSAEKLLPLESVMLLSVMLLRRGLLAKHP